MSASPLMNSVNAAGSPAPGGPTFSFRGIDNPCYSILERDRAKHSNCSACGNTLNASHPVVRRMILTEYIQQASKSWHGVKLNQPDWSEYSQSFAFQTELGPLKRMTFLIVNGHAEPLNFELPPLASGKFWRRWIDTSLPSPDDICEWDSTPPITGTTYHARSRSIVLLLVDPVVASTNLNIISAEAG